MKVADTMTATAHRNFSVIIIGAGASGIAAATKLLENGVEDILILEAENRIGGRISSVKFGDAYVDAGAEFCHGENSNIVFQLAKDLNVLKHGKGNIEMYYSNGDKVCRQLAKEIYEFVESYEDLERNGCDRYTTIGSFVSDRVPQWSAIFGPRRRGKSECQSCHGECVNVIYTYSEEYWWLQNKELLLKQSFPKN